MTQQLLMTRDVSDALGRISGKMLGRGAAPTIRPCSAPPSHSTGIRPGCCNVLRLVTAYFRYFGYVSVTSAVVPRQPTGSGVSSHNLPPPRQALVVVE